MSKVRSLWLCAVIAEPCILFHSPTSQFYLTAMLFCITMILKDKLKSTVFFLVKVFFLLYDFFVCVSCELKKCFSTTMEGKIIGILVRIALNL